MPDAPISGHNAQALAKLSIFGALKQETIEFLADLCEEVKVPEGENFFNQDESGDSLFVLLRGRIAVIRTSGTDRLILAELGAGACFGETALIAISPRCASVRALEDCTALRLRNRSILRLYEHDLEQFTLLQMNLGREVARRLVLADKSLFEYARRLGET